MRALNKDGIKKHLVRGMKGLYDRYMVCLRWGRRMGECLDVKRQGHVMSLCLFNVFSNRVKRPMNKKATGKGVKQG